MPPPIHPGLRPQYGTYSAGHEYSSDCLAREAEGFRAAEAEVPTDFDGLAKWLGYGKPGTLKKAIRDLTDRADIIAALTAAGVDYADNSDRLASAFIAEIAASVPELMAAE